MSGLLHVVGVLAFAVGLLGIAKGSVRTLGLTSRRACAVFTAAAVALLAAAGAGPSRPAPATSAAAHTTDVVAAARTPTASATPATPPSTAAQTSAQRSARAAATPLPLGALLLMASGGDGDSWRDTRGIEYRMGLINTPEVGECGGSTATAYRKQRLANGFHARTYSTDHYGRRVSVIYTAGGVNLNVDMARLGIANDRYLAEFRHENPALARQLDAAFAEARAAHRGLWGSCRVRTAPAPVQPLTAAPPSSDCHPDYLTCIPVKGDGSGAGAANDLDCGDVRKVVHLRVAGRDPYRLDANGDGVGCESYS